MGATSDTTRRPRLAPRLGRAVRRALVILLDIRGRWWLSLWLWLPFGGWLCFEAALARDGFGGQASTSETSLVVGVREDGRVVPGIPGDEVEHWRVNLASDLTMSGIRWSVTLDAQATLVSQGHPGTDAQLAASAAAQAGIRYLYHDIPAYGAFEFVEKDAHAWLGEVLPEMIERGETVRTRLPTPRVLVAYIGLTIAQYACLAGILIAMLSWFLRGAQVGAYRRMLRRHEAGRCPHCDYDISAAPDLPCPECGCDHRARRAEAVEALQRARR